MTCTRHLAHDHSVTCTECTRRAQAGPGFDARRGSGRTTQAVKTALIAALGGHRVLYVASSNQAANDLCKYALQLLSEAQCKTAPGNVTEKRITLKCGGWLEFRSMHAEKPRGLREEHTPTQEWWDHFAAEERARIAAKKVRMDDAAMIHSLMRKHGWTECKTDHLIDALCQLS